jgi:hypothetical protein
LRIGESGEEEDEQGNALESLVASGGIEPLVNRVGSATGATGTDGDGFQAERERYVGIGRGAEKPGVDSKLGIDGADGGQ